jgi:hypothetical protein
VSSILLEGLIHPAKSRVSRWIGGSISGRYFHVIPDERRFHLLPDATIAFFVAQAGNADLVRFSNTTLLRLSSFTFWQTESACRLPKDSIFISIVGGTVMVNDATVIDADILALNGTRNRSCLDDSGGWSADQCARGIKRGDRSYNLQACIRNPRPNYSTALEASGLDAVLDDPTETLTALGPTNAAFDALPPGLLSTLLTARLFPSISRYFALPCFG